jgi:deferrochelatase/peroxidase EfeB
MRSTGADYGKVQGLVRSGYDELTEARFHVLRIEDAAAARAWLAAAPITWAIRDRRPERALQVAFTCDGLQQLGLSTRILCGFSQEFKAGMAESNRARRLGDIAANDPADWLWGGSAMPAPHLLVMLYAKAGDLARWQTEAEGRFWAAAFSSLYPMCTDYNGKTEPFGFADGISQPKLDWDRQLPARLRTLAEYTNISALGEFLLGYPNEYGRYTDRPLLDPSDDPENLLPEAEDAPGKKDFGRNGTYLVARDLAQDVPGLWQFVAAQARHTGQQPDKVAAAMVGRMPGLPGSPMASRSKTPIEGIDDVSLNGFTFHEDPDGVTCPLGAHIRRANPRNADLPQGTRGLLARAIRVLGFGGQHPHDDLLASARFHRILRRGREYGPKLEREAAMKGDPSGVERGLRFICLNANISRQFEFIQTSWIDNSKFDGLDEADPLLGNRAPLWAGDSTDSFTRPRDDGLLCRMRGLPRFVTVRGGGYFFMPGKDALDYLARSNGGPK